MLVSNPRKTVNMNFSEHITDLKQVVFDHPVDRHPFLERFRSGALSADQVRFWLKEQFHFSISLPSAFAVLFARIPDKFWKEKRALVDLLNVEAWGAQDLEAHSRKFLLFADSLHLPLDELIQSEPKTYTQGYVQERFAMCLERPVLQGLVAIAFGNEILNLSIFSAYREGIQKVKGLEMCSTEYFDAHLSDEDSDFAVFVQLIDALSPTNTDWQLMHVALRELLDKRWIFMDKLLQDIDCVQ